jgi:hypothetical protein
MRIARSRKVFAFAAVASCLAGGGSFAQDVETLERQLEKAREAAPMALKHFMAVAKPAKYFGDFEQRERATYSRGEKLHFYMEPKNLSVTRNANGVYEPALEVDLEVKPERGQPARQPKFLSLKIPSRSPIQDIYLNMTVSLGEAPAGKYSLKFTVRDLNSKKTATAEQEVTLR